ncbi:hypothetical protein E0Z10_g10486 [Xylaria hypoxylon]|uniref:5'-3' DNA helicase ZGRF1-like N-terminal domain-containing protein n=1 Tax=Xylaria hypoxylon TaxID=37992 RepID=A0A4Z0YKV7_9PEZI|nr:hypothetical protein E0Z10_g10486 [Xylaria hypoxylon]
MQSSALTTHTQSSATTAPVRDHACLFTHDLHRKQKRWQDGRLKYHTFNRRVMVYDERGNFVGDTHWREDYDLGDGDDLELERGGIIIQVGECVGSRDQDLSDLIDKRAQEKVQRQAAAATRRPPVTTVTALHVVKPQPQPQKHLHDILGTPSGHHGRAVLPQESPYEERRQRLAPPQSDDNRPAKRQRREFSPPSKSGYAQNLFGATLSLSGRSSSQAPAYSRSSNQIPLQTYEAQLSTKHFARLHSSVRPEPSSYARSGILDEPGKPPTPQKPQSRLLVSQEKEIIGGRFEVDPQSKNSNPHKSRGIDDTLEQADLRVGQLGKPPSLGVLKKIRDKNKKSLSSSSDCTQKQKHRDRNTIDLTEDRANLPEQLVHDEPKTELRIKPRKKRGLLMISERDTICDSSSEPTKTGPEGHDFPLLPKAQFINVSADRRGNKFPKETEKTASQLKKMDDENDGHERVDHTNYQSSRIANAEHAEDEKFGGAQCVDRHNSRSWKGSTLRATVEQDDTHAAEMCAVGTERSLRPRKRPSTEDTVFSSGADEGHGHLYSANREDSAAVHELPAPRLAKLGRKGIKSKEVIGFIFDDEPDPIVSVKQNGHAQRDPSLDSQPDQGFGKQQHQSNNEVRNGLVTTETRLSAEPQSPRKRLLLVQKQKSVEPRFSNDEVNLTIHTEGPSAVTAITTKQPTLPIANPATRGKKAAKPSDAAGQMPICPLPAEPVESASLNQKPRKMNVQENHKGSASPMPGFSRANGGPWSREAHDLFDFKRPP